MGAARRFALRLYRAIRIAIGSFSADFCPQMAAAISYHVLFSLFPLAIFLVSILGVVLRDDARRERVVGWLVDNLPLSEIAGSSLDDAVAGLATPASLAGLVALVGVLWSASGMMAALRISLASVWGVERRRPYVRGKALDLLLVALAGLFVLAAFGLTVLTQVVGELSQEIAGWLEPIESVVTAAGQVTEIAIPLALLIPTILLLYRYVPPVKPRFADLWPAAVLCGIAVQVTIVGYGFYLSRFADYNLVYGSLGAAIGFLFLVYLAASIFLFCGEIAAAWPEAGTPREGAA